MLACAIAHELGHLLLPVRTHAPAGLMRACWSRDEFHRAEQGQLTFLPEEVARIREGDSGTLQVAQARPHWPGLKPCATKIFFG